MAEIRTSSITDEHALTKLASSSPPAPQPEEEPRDDEGTQDEEGEGA